MTRSSMKLELCWGDKRMVNLETTEKKAEKVVEFLRKHVEYLV